MHISHEITEKNLRKKLDLPKFSSYVTYPLKPPLSLEDVIKELFFFKFPLFFKKNPNFLTLKTSTKTYAKFFFPRSETTK